MSETPQKVAEIVTFRLNPGVDPADFIAAAQAIDPILQASAAVLGRTLSCDADGLWTDHITWTSMAAAQATANQMMADPLSAPMMQMIAADGVSMRHAPVLYEREAHAPD